MRPPSRLDNAEVVRWAWSAPDPFFVMPCSDGSGGIPIHGLAICQYPQGGAVYRFSCYASWQVQNDAPYGSVADAEVARHGQYDVTRVAWRPLDGRPSREVLLDPRLSTLVRDYQRTVAEAVAMLEAHGMRRPTSNTDWVTSDAPGRRTLPGGFRIFKHGYGCAVKGPDWAVDFDFGDEGQIDGFDAWRLCAFAGPRLRGYGFTDEKDIAAAIRRAAEAGALRFSGYILYYVVEAERGAG